MSCVPFVTWITREYFGLSLLIILNFGLYQDYNVFFVYWKSLFISRPNEIGIWISVYNIEMILSFRHIERFSHMFAGQGVNICTVGKHITNERSCAYINFLISEISAEFQLICSIIVKVMKSDRAFFYYPSWLK